MRAAGRALAPALLPCFVLALDGCSGRGRFADAAETGTDGRPWLEECAHARGLDFVLRSGHGERYLFPEIMCGGVALFDLDGDGDLDVYFVQAGGVEVAPEERPGNQLFANDGGGTFRDVSAGSGADDHGYGMGVATGDFDGDGKTDLYVTNVGPNVLLASHGDGTFTDVTAASGAGVDGWSSSAAFFDGDRDGDLDLFVVQYIFWSPADELLCQGPPHGPTYCSPLSYDAPAPDVLLRNQGDGTFRDVSIEAGLRTSFGNGLGIVCSDFDGDGWPDVFVANDGTTDDLWKNHGDGTFEDVAVRMGCAVDQDGDAKAGMGVAAADVDDDGDEDLLVVNLDGESDSFYRNDRTHFSDRTPLAGLALPSRTFTRFGVGLVDLDDDGWLDLYVADGRVVHPPGEIRGDDPFAEPNLLLSGSASGRFEELSPRGGTAPELVHTSRGAAFGDLDGDGRLDVVVVNKDAPAYLLRNVAPHPGHWLSLRALGSSGADALGATVSLSLGTRRITRTVRSASSYQSASDPRIHLGLGPATRATDVLVRWPEGELESFGSLDADRAVTLLRGTGRPARD